MRLLAPDPGRRVCIARRATCWVFFANGGALGSWVPHIPDAKLALSLSDSLLGSALLGMAVGSLIGLPLSRMLTARFGSRKTTTAAIFALLLATPFPILAPTLPVFALTLVFLGIANGAVDVAMNTQAIAIEERLARPIMSSFHGLFSGGGVAGAAIAGLAIDIGIAPKTHLLATVVGLIMITLFAVPFLLPTTPARTKATRAAATSFRLPRGPLLALGVLSLCSLMAEGAIGDWTAVYLRDDLSAGAGFAALGFVSFSLTMTSGRFLGDRAIRRYGGPAVLAAGTGIAATLLAAALAVGEQHLAVLGFAAVGLGLANAVPVLFSAAGKIAGTPPELALAAVSTAGYCGFLFGPPVIGLIADRFGLGVGLGVVALALAVVALGGACAAVEGTRRWTVSLSASK